MNSMMIDIETLDTKETAAVFQVGVVVFDEGYNTVREELYNISKEDIEFQLEAGRTMSLDTMLFHIHNPDNIKYVLNPNNSTDFSFAEYLIEDVIENLKHIIIKYGVNDIWQKGSMDLSVLSHVNGGDFWHYHQPRELRTLMQECGVERGEPTHNALEDCHLQVSKLSECRGTINAKT